jgi:cytochrome c
VKVVEYELHSPDWNAKVAASKFAHWPGYGMSPPGRIALPQHGAQENYRNIRIRVLP